MGNHTPLTYCATNASNSCDHGEQFSFRPLDCVGEVLFSQHEDVDSKPLTQGTWIPIA